MARGFVGGVIAGTVVSGLVLGAASVLTGTPDIPPPEAVAVEVPAGSEFDQSREDSAASLPEIDPTLQPAGASPVVETPAPDDLNPLAGADTEPAARPETGLAQGDLSAPQVPAGEEDTAAQEDSPVMARDQAAEPGADDLSISTDPAQPEAPLADEGAGLARPPAVGDADVDGNAFIPETESDAPSGTIGNLAAGVGTDRLPKVTDTVPEDQPTLPARMPAIETNAVPFTNPEQKPLMAIVLIDDGSSPLGLEALKDFPYPLNFAVDPGWSGAAEAAHRYRDAGFEVLAMADLPPGAQPVDTETVIQTVLATLPDAVAIMEGTGDGLQSGREAAEQLAPILLETGHGLVLFPKGLDTVQKLIAREGVPAATIFRDFDDKGQNETVIRRFLDQAAFKANREDGGVIMLGRLRADTITALLLWGLQDRANRVALAPVSAVLTGK